MTPTAKAKVIAYFYLPLLILALVAFYGGGLSGSEPGIAVAELKTEINGMGEQSSKRGLVVIAEATSSEYIIPLAPNGAKVWSSLDENSTRGNKERIRLNQQELKLITPFIGESSPVTLVVEGDLGKEINIPGEKVSVDKWGLSSRRSTSLVYGVLIICSLSLGLGVAVGFPVKPEQHNTGQVGKEPGKKRVIERHAINPPARKARVRPRPKTNRKKIPRIDEQGQ